MLHDCAVASVVKRAQLDGSWTCDSLSDSVPRSGLTAVATRNCEACRRAQAVEGLELVVGETVLGGDVDGGGGGVDGGAHHVEGGEGVERRGGGGVLVSEEPHDDPHGVVLDEAHQVAAELGLPWYWLNDQASVYVSRTEDRQAVRVFDHPGVRVSAASAEHLLAMKALAGRRFADHDDLATLIRILGLSSVAQVAEICARVFPEEPLSDRARLLVEDVLDELRKSGEGAP